MIYSRKKSSMACVARTLGCSLMTVITLQAAPLFDVNFSADTVGSQPVTSAAPSGTTAVNPTSIWTGSGPGATDILVAQDYTAGTATLAGNSAVFTSDGSRALELTFAGNVNDFVQDQDYRLSFDMLISSSSMSGGWSLHLYDVSYNTQGYLYFASNGTLELVSGSNSVGISNAWQAEQVLSFTVDMLYSVGKMTLSINDATPWEVDLGTLPSPAGVRSFAFSRPGANSFEFAVTDIAGAAVPEPSTVLLLLLCGGLLVFSRNRFSRRA